MKQSIHSDSARGLLANASWRCLAGAHAHYSRSHGTARRYAHGFAPVAAFADPTRPDLPSLAVLSEPGETLALPGVSAASHPAWRPVASVRFAQMVRWTSRARPVHGFTMRRLSDADLPALQALVEAAGIRMFGPSMLMVGEHFGITEGGRLVAVAATRTVVGGFREIGTVCTHPDHRGRGLASSLVQEVAASIEARGEVPFLHTEAEKKHLAALYMRCGFEPLQEVPMLVVQRTAGAAA